VRSFTFSWLPLLVYAGLIFYLSSLPNPPQPFTSSSADKVLHIVEYAILGILVINILKQYYPEQRKKRLQIFAGFLSTPYGMSDEFHQYFVPFKDKAVLIKRYNYCSCIAFNNNRKYKVFIVPFRCIFYQDI